MEQRAENPIIEIIGREIFQWLSLQFNEETTLSHVPEEILDRIGSIDVTIRDYARDRNAITAIALLTFAYNMAKKAQVAQHGSNDIMLLKALVKGEKRRRQGKPPSFNEMWGAPLYEIITGEVGDRIRATSFMTNPMQP